MKKLTTEFIKNHIDEHFLIGINSLYWMGTPKSSIANVLDYGEYPLFSEQFYKCYGTFSPINPEIALNNIRDEKCSIQYIDESVLWKDFVKDVIGFFHSNKCTYELKKLIKESFFEHYEYISMADDSEQEAMANEIFNDYNDDKMLIFFQFRDYLWKWKP
jgi:hypothetical protein